MTHHWAPGTAYGLGDQVMFAWSDPQPVGGEMVTRVVTAPEGWMDVGYVNDTDSASALRRFQQPRNDRAAEFARHYRPGWEQVMRLAASAANDPKIEWRNPERRDLDAYRCLVDEDMAKLAEMTRTPPIFQRPLVTATVGGENPGDDVFTHTYHPITGSIDINLPRKKKKIMTAALSNGGHISVGITISADTDDGNLTAYETLLLAARHVGAAESETVTLDSSGDPTIELQDHEVDLHALADLIQPQTPPVEDFGPLADEEPPAEELKSRIDNVDHVGFVYRRPFEGATQSLPAVRYESGAVSYLMPGNTHWTFVLSDHEIAKTFAVQTAQPLRENRNH